MSAYRICFLLITFGFISGVFSRTEFEFSDFFPEPKINLRDFNGTWKNSITVEIIAIDVNGSLTRLNLTSFETKLDNWAFISSIYVNIREKIILNADNDRLILIADTKHITKDDRRSRCLIYSISNKR